MKFTPNKCPQCGEPIMGTVENVPGVALLTIDDATGHFEYEGETKMFWDGQTTVKDDDGRTLVQCHNGHEWAVDADPICGCGRTEDCESTPCGTMCHDCFMKHIRHCGVCHDENAKFPVF